MDNVNKPAAISVAATVIVCIAAVTLLVLWAGWHGGYGRWIVPRSETLRPLIATGFIIWGWHSACWYWGLWPFDC